MRSAFYAFVFLVFSSGTSLADYSQSKAWFHGKDWDQRVRIQHLLVFTGDYDTIVDGAFGPNTYDALISFQKHRDYPQDGVLGDDQMQILLRDGLDLANRVGFEVRDDRAAGLSLGIPVKLFEPPAQTRRGNLWRAYDGSIELETLAIPRTETDYEELFERLSGPRSGRSLDRKELRNDFFVVSGEQDGRPFYVRIMKTAGDSRGFSLSWEPKHTVFMNRIAVAMSNSMKFHDRGKGPEAVAAPPDLRNAQPQVEARTHSEQ